MVFSGTPYLYTYLELRSKEWKAVSIRLPEPLETGEYGVDLLIANDFHSRIPNDYFIFASEPLQVTSTTAVKGIEDMRSNDVEPSGQWYDLNGRKFGRHPTAKGVYIFKGKKVIINK